MIVAYYALHYGKEWLAWSIKSIIKYVDVVVISYTPRPSYGFQTATPNPDTKEELQGICTGLNSIYSNKIRWVEPLHAFCNEGEHRHFAVNYCAKIGAEYVVVVDQDEIWPQGMLPGILGQVAFSPYRQYAVNMMSFYRSLKWVCYDGYMPVRVLKLSVRDNSMAIVGNAEHVFHMGYAQSSKLIEYKQAIHGHKDEWRSDWWEKRFLNWKPGDGDVHPVAIGLWTPVAYIDDGKLEAVVGDHPYWGMDIIP